ncbi:hypothetical protein WN944_026489 [Citrus x changshan-huyou]|uniref:Uncharacterized protein n=1 Tax=Citrus x changshan-huyou TaxID=2935761 RepID=A0AAP0LRQ0_9ROSI
MICAIQSDLIRVGLDSENQMGHDGDQLSINIDDILKEVPDILCLPTITKVPENLYSVNVKAYEPEMIAISAFTYELRSKNHSKLMEEHKNRFLKKLLQRRGEESAKDYVMTMKDLEKRARRCYSEPVSLSSDQFVVMIVLDACFIIELFRYTAQNEWNDPILWIICIPGKLGRDLLLADNQLPFFVLQKFNFMT